MKRLRYLRAKAKLTLSSTSITVCSSRLAESLFSIFIEPPTASLETLNLIDVFVVSMFTVSFNEYNSLQILVNSTEDIVTVELY